MAAKKQQQKQQHEFLIHAYDSDAEFIDEKLVNSENEFDAMISAICRLRYDVKKSNKPYRILASVHVIKIDGHGIDPR